MGDVWDVAEEELVRGDVRGDRGEVGHEAGDGVLHAIIEG